MVIISNQNVKQRGKDEIHISYDEFKLKAFGDDGFDADGTPYFNVAEIEDFVYDAVKGEEVKFFTIGGRVPDFISEEIEDWSEKEEVQIVSSNLDSKQYSDEKIAEPASKAEITKIADLLDGVEPEEEAYSHDHKEAKVFVFGSSKGGTGKTFTAAMSAYRYAKTHQNERVALIDFDVIDGQVGISIHKIKPTMRQFYNEYQKGYSDFGVMKNFSVKANPPYPQNVDFYLAPNNGTVIQNDDFWLSILKNCIDNYDVVVVDTGIDYLNIAPISYAYKVADKVILITTTSIKSVNSVTKQIGKLKGETANSTFKVEDEIASRLNIVITQMLPTDEMNKTIYNTLAKKANVVATFGVITDSVSQAEFYGLWDVFDKNANINKAFDDIML